MLLKDYRVKPGNDGGGSAMAEGWHFAAMPERGFAWQ